MLPKATKMQIDNYVGRGVPPSGFLHAVLSNNLMETVMLADAINHTYLTGICRYLQGYTPTLCYGSPENVKAWLQLHRTKPEEAEEYAACDRERRQALD